MADYSPSAVPQGCHAPSRDEYLAQYGFTIEDRDLSDPDVVQAREHTVLFVFDRSGSMADRWGNEGVKWDIARASMESAVEPFKSYVNAGAVFFAMDEDDQRVAEIVSDQQIDYRRGDAFLRKWKERIPECSPSTDTPLYEAMLAADRAIHHACNTGFLNTPFKVVLITDGAPTTYYDHDEVLALVSKWYSIGVTTIVIGMPGSAQASRYLSDIAYVGRTGNAIENITEEESQQIIEEVIYEDDEASSGFSNDLLVAID
jgi:hypothetical protein